MSDQSTAAADKAESAAGTETTPAEPGGAEPGSAEPGGAEPGGAEPGGAEPGEGGPDRTVRHAAFWATLIALPLTVLLALVLLNRLAPETTSGSPGDSTPSAGAPPTGVPPQVVPPEPVPMVAAPLTERQAVVCRALLSQLPAAVRNLPQRPVTAGPEQNAAYGEPPLTLACGTPPPSYPPTDDLWTVNSVCWHALEGTEATVLRTVDREAPVRVTVPATYEQPLQWVSEISKALVASVPSTKTVPSGCRP